MKKGLVIFGSLLFLIFAGLCIVVAIAVSNSPSHFSSPDEERGWARADYESLFINPTEPLPLLSSDPAITRTTMEEKPNKVEFTFPEIPNDNSEFTRFGTRIDTKPGDTAAKLSDGNTLRFLGVATYFPEKIHERHLNGFTDLVWHEPATLEPLDKSTVSERNLETTTRLDLTERTLVLAFDVSDQNLPHRWQSVNTRNANTLCRVNSSSRSQTREKVYYVHLELEIYHQSPVKALLSISHGEPETQTLDFTTHPLNQPVFFHSKNVQLKIPFRSDGNQNSTSWGGGGAGLEKIEFSWTASSQSSSQKSFAIVDCWPPVQWRQFEWRPTKREKNRNYWRGGHGDEGLSSINFSTKLADTGPMEVRYFPDLTHVSFRLNSIPGLPELDNLFKIHSGPIRFQYNSDARRFLSNGTQTQAGWNGKVWPDSSYPLEFDNITPDEIIAEIENQKGIKLDVDPKTYKIEEWNPKPLVERLSDWFKNLF